jgi:cysteine desulfurase family protein (TIGR01976 family)
MRQYDVEYVRAQFPALKRTVNGHQAAYLDGPGGAQVPQRVVDAVSDYLLHHNSNIQGAFATSEETDRILDGARRALADFLGADWQQVSFGTNMTTLTIFMAQSLARDWVPGDEIIVTALDHEANRGPWLDLQERGIVVREAPVDVEACTLVWDEMEKLVNERTKLLALGYASNAVGTVNDVERAAELAHSVGALCWVDAVHFALHGAIDVRAIDCDFLVCSPYKFFGPHIGVLYAKPTAGEGVRPLKLATQEEQPPFRYETGTLCHEGISGAAEAVEFIADLGRHHREDGEELDRRSAVIAGMRTMEAYERVLASRLIEGLGDVPGLRIYGPPAGAPRTSTVSFVLDGWHAHDLARELGAKGIFVWDGDFYAARFVELAGLAERGGLLRIGLCPYNTADEVERVIAELVELAGRASTR